MRRTRRDLSNPKIKRLISREIKREPRSTVPVFRESPFIKILKISIYFFILAFLGLAIYKYLPQIFPTGIQITHNSKISSVQPNTKLPPISNTSPQQLPDQSAKTPPAKPEFQPVPRKTQVEVLNGCGVDKIASRTTKFLRKHNIDVVSMGNYSRFDVKTTFILNRSGKNDKVSEVAKVLGIPATQIQLKKDLSLQLDATIVLGSDYKKLKPFQKNDF